MGIIANQLAQLNVVIGATATQFEKTMSKVQKNMRKTGEKMKSIGSKMTAGITAPVTAGFAALTEGTRDFRETMAPLETNAQLAGASMDRMSEAMAQMQGVTGETDANVEGLNNLLASGFKGENFSTVLDSLSGAAIKFKDTMKFEGVADGLQETLATGSAIGPFAELLERSGVDLDKFNEGLAEAQKNGTEQNYIMNTLANTGLANVYESYKANNKEITEHREATFKLQEQLAKLGNKLEPLMTKLINAATKVVEWFNELDPTTQRIIGVLTGLAAVLGPVIFAVGQLVIAASAIPALFASIGGAVATVSAFLGSLALGPIAAVIAAVVAVIAVWKNWDKIVNFVKWFVGKVKGFIKPFAEKVKSIFESLKDNTIGVFQDMWSGIKQIINWVIGGVNKMIESLNKFQVDVPKWAQKLPGVGESFGFNIDKVPTLETNTDVEGSGSGDTNINIDNMNVRNDQDIKKIAKEIEYIKERKNRRVGP